MVTVESIIDEEEWAEKYEGKTEAEQKAIFESGLSDSIRRGYGFYGCRFTVKDNKHVVVWQHGNSCD